MGACTSSALSMSRSSRTRVVPVAAITLVFLLLVPCFVDCAPPEDLSNFQGMWVCNEGVRIARAHTPEALRQARASHHCQPASC